MGSTTFDLGLTLLISTEMQKSIATRIFVCVLKICQGIRRYGFGGKFLCKAMMTAVYLEIVFNRLDAEAFLFIRVWRILQTPIIYSKQ